MSPDIQSMMDRLGPAASLAGYTVESFPDDPWCIYNVGGEVKLWLRQENGWYVLSESERDRDERIFFAGANLRDMELVLVYRMANRHRRRIGSPLLVPTSAPVTPDQTAKGFDLGRKEYGAWVLRDSATGSVWLGRMITLTEFSHFAGMAPWQLWDVMTERAQSSFSTLS
ncbi:Imm61 family immunity protein [Paenarthrobacter sp. NPDC056912]|uniref:Imm61 family immunity protein n=1 Tax=Paenarthrobacter sp. NPDC056912 TaxID=3345965 RepID=UPI00366A60D7